MVHRWWILTGVACGTFMAILDASIVNIALPTLTKALHAEFAAVEWVILSYSLVLTTLMLGVARLGDMLDKKRIYLTGLSVFTLGSCLCGLSPSIGWLIAARALQGLGAVMMQALGSAIVTEVFPPSERGRALGIIGGIVSVGIAVGPPLGGLLIGLSGWQTIFWVNVPIGLLTAAAVLRFVPSRPAARPGQRFDFAGMFILLVTLACYALGMTFGQRDGFGAVQAVALLAAALAGLMSFVWVETRVRQPMVDLSLFRSQLFSTNLMMGFLVFIVLSGGFILPFFLEYVKGYPTELIGLFMMASPVMMGIMAPIAGGLSDRFGSRQIGVIGLLVLFGGCLAMGTIHPGVTPLGIILRLVPFGAGLGIFQSPNNSAIMGAAPRERLGVASGLMSLSRTLGNSTGLPLMGSIFAAQVAALAGLPPGSDPTAASAAALVGGVTLVYHVSAGILLAVLGLAVFSLLRQPRVKPA